MAQKRGDGLARGEIPDADMVPGQDGGDAAGVGAEDDRTGEAFGADDGVTHATRCGVPEQDSSVGGGEGKEASIGIVSHGCGLSGISDEQAVGEQGGFGGDANALGEDGDDARAGGMEIENASGRFEGDRINDLRAKAGVPEVKA